MGSNRGTGKAFPPPTEEDIKAVWSVVAKLDASGEVTGRGRAVARCIYALEQMREAVGLYRVDVQKWNFKGEGNAT